MNIVDIFAGVGGSSLGFEMASDNNHVILANELVPEIAESYKKNHPHTVMANMDVKDFVNSNTGANIIDEKTGTILTDNYEKYGNTRLYLPVFASLDQASVKSVMDNAEQFIFKAAAVEALEDQLAALEQQYFLHLSFSLKKHSIP